MKRIVLFLLTNLAVVLVLGVVCSLLGVDRYLTQNGLNLSMLLVFSAIMGMGGSFISLLMSKWIAKRSTGATVITQPRNSGEMWLLQTVERQARAAGIAMPEVAIYDSPEPNAFATGANRNAALVAVSTGLLNAMTQEEVEAVLGHEIGHVANGDMVTLTLIQGVVNTFVIFLSRVIAYFVDSALRRGEERDSGPGIAYLVVSMLMQVVLGIGASMVVAAFSRWREFRADAAGARFAGKRKMIAALQRLRAFQQAPETLPKEMNAFGIRGGVASLFSSHPPLEQRIATLEAATGN
jgi:heat shock protein HtpX